MTLTPDQERLFIAELEKLGEAQVRSNLERGKISPAVEYVALAWLAEREREAKASQSEQIELTRRASIGQRRR
jgi:hypothetical protein